MFAAVAGGGKHTVVMSAGFQENAMLTENPKDDTAGVPKVKWPIAKQNGAGERG